MGHLIPEQDLEKDTETRILDAGAEVRVCRLHAAPIAVTVQGAGDSEAPVEQSYDSGVS